MYETEPTEYGFKMTFSGFVDADDLEPWAEEVRDALDSTAAEWHCFVDMREMETMSSGAQQLMSEVKAECHEAELERVATLVDSPTVRLQFEQMAEDSGNTDERYLDAQSTDDPEAAAVAWVRDGIEPGG